VYIVLIALAGLIWAPAFSAWSCARSYYEKGKPDSRLVASDRSQGDRLEKAKYRAAKSCPPQAGNCARPGRSSERLGK